MVNESFAGQLTPEEAEAHPQKNIITTIKKKMNEMILEVILESVDYLIQ